MVLLLAESSQPDGFVWFEVIGESHPLLNLDAVGGKTPAPHLYEYHWSLGYPPSGPIFKHRALRLLAKNRNNGKLLHLADPAAHVRLFFATQPNWRVSEHVATVKHLSPVRQEFAWRKQLAHDWSEVAPILGSMPLT